MNSFKTAREYENKFAGRGLTFDDVLLIPAKSDILPSDVIVKTRLAKDIYLNIPIITAAMDTITEHEMGIAIANEGGIGVIHKNMSIAKQAKEVAKVKAFPVDKKSFPLVSTDKEGRLLSAAAIGATSDVLDRAGALIEAGADVLILDSAHGHSQNILNSIKTVKKAFPETALIAGNVATALGTLDVIKSGADGVKIGIGPGSICTTRVVAGVGVPQITAIFEAGLVAKEHDIPIIADGGMKSSGDIAKAITAGASTVMVGSLVAGTDETPTDLTEIAGKKFKVYRGMGSLAAMGQGSKDRYFQEHNKKMVPEGVEGHVIYKGPVSDSIYQILGGLKAGMGYCGCATIEEMQSRAQFVEITTAGLIESHPHDVRIEKSAPNYFID